MKIIYNMTELAKKLGTGKITSIVVTDLCLCIECEDTARKQEKYTETQKPTKTITKKPNPQKPNKLADFMRKMEGPRF
jgi:hypothetical protein